MGKKAKMGRKRLSLAALAALLLTGGWLWHTWEKIPASIRIKAGVEQQLSLHVPALGEIYLTGSEREEAVPAADMQLKRTDGQVSLKVDFNRPVTLRASQTQNYMMDVKLFGVLPFKQVDVEVIPDAMLVPVGVPIGIYVKTDGVLIIAQGDFEGLNGSRREPAAHLLYEGDYILKADGEQIESKQQLIDKIAHTYGAQMVLTIRRGEEVFDVKVKPEQNVEGEYKLGIWVRDNAQGVGTMTYLDQDHTFGALGHGINDIDTTALMDVKSGSLYRTQIVSIIKGEDGNPGELTGVIDYNPANRIGTISVNSTGGIFGVLSDEMADSIQGQAVPIGLRQEVKTGPAQILCCVDKETVPQLYEVQIQEIHLDHDNVNRGLELVVTDPELLEKTGGIVQGMSGSPILQDGKLIGAVTHVLVNDPTRGYGIFIENMLLTEP